MTLSFLVPKLSVSAQILRIKKNLEDKTPWTNLTNFKDKLLPA